MVLAYVSQFYRHCILSDIVAGRVLTSQKSDVLDEDINS